jgi:hypothetical protein
MGCFLVLSMVELLLAFSNYRGRIKNVPLSCAGRAANPTEATRCAEKADCQETCSEGSPSACSVQAPKRLITI